MKSGAQRARTSLTGPGTRWWLAAGWLALAMVAALGWTGGVRTWALHHRPPYPVLSAAIPEPRELVRELGRTVRAAFPDDDLPVLTNLPAFGSALDYDARRPLLYNHTSAAHWREASDQLGGRVAGVIWLDAPNGEALAAGLTEGRQQTAEVAGVRFCLWHDNPT